MKKSNYYYEAFEICLNQIFSGNETIESAVDQFPDIADQLRPELEAAFWIYTKRDATLMRPGYLTASRQRLVDQINQGEKTSVVNPSPIWKQFVFRFAFTALFLMLSVWAYRGGTQAVRASLPGDRLYDLKLAAEDVQLLLASDTDTEAELRIELADKRAKEAADLLEQGRYEDAEIALDGYRQSLSIAADLVDKMGDESERKVALAQKLASTVTRHNERFAVFIATGKMPGTTVAVLGSTIMLNDEIVATMVVILDEFDEGSVPILASVVPTASMTPTPTPSSTATPSLLMEAEPSATPIPSRTPTLVNSDTPEPSDTPQPSRTPAPLEPTDNGGDDEPKPTKTPKPEKPTKTPKPKKPTKTPKDKDKD